MQNRNAYLMSRTLVPLLIIALPIAAMIAYILYHQKADLPVVNETQTETVSFGSESWTIFRGDPGLTGRATGSLPKKLKKSWTFQTGDSIVSTAVIANNRVFLSSTDHFCYALEIETGKEIWRFEADDDLEASPLCHDETLYIGSNSGTFYALDSEDGSLIRSYETGGKITGSANIAIHPVTKRTVVLFGSYDNYLYCLDAESGDLIFQYPAESYINGSIAIDENAAVFGSCDANIYWIPIADPNSAKTINAGSYVAANPAIDNGIVFACSFEGVFLTADIKTKEVIWQFNETEEAFFSSPAVDENVTIVGCRDRNVYCFDRHTGQKLWTFSANGNFDSSPVICGDSVAIGCEDGRLYILEIKTGEEVFAYTLGSPVVSCPAVAQNRIFIGCENGLLYALGLKGH